MSEQETVEPGATVKQDPDAFIVRTFDWTDWLGEAAEIDSATVTVTEAVGGDVADLTIDNAAVDAGNKTVTFRASGGEVGAKYLITCHIVTNETVQQEDDRSVWLAIRER